MTMEVRYYTRHDIIETVLYGMYLSSQWLMGSVPYVEVKIGRAKDYMERWKKRSR